VLATVKSCPPPGRGGGLLKLVVDNIFTFTGLITSNGSTGSVTGGSIDDGAGGGSGGGINIVVDTFQGSGGVIRANGGAGGNSNSDGGGGSGGRVAFIYDVDSYTGGIVTLDFQSIGGEGNAAKDGAPGTVYIQDTVNDIAGRLIIDNSTKNSFDTTPLIEDLSFDSIATLNNAKFELISTGNLTLLSPIVDFYLEADRMVNFTNSNITIASGGQYLVHHNSAITWSSLTIENAGLLAHWANTTAEDYFLDISITGNADIQFGGSINVNGKGYSASNGPGAGPTRAAGTDGGNGGGHGGIGGIGFNGAAGGIAYDTATDPLQIGSGGSAGDCAGGAGGGLLLLVVDGTFTLDGDIFANGSNGSSCANSGGGGAGGTINIITNILAGTSGNIYVNGGNTDTSADDGGGGGGGMLRLTYSTDLFTLGESVGLDKEVNGGTGFGAGNPGTIEINP